MMAPIASTPITPAPVSAPAGVSLDRSRSRWQKLLMIAFSVLLLSAAFAPFKQFYLAWVAQVPMILIAIAARSKKSAFFWGWLCGSIFFL
jgi:apolipoprotein N-acyltransferase